MIETIKFSHLRKNEFLQFLKDVAARCDKFDTDTLKLAVTLLLLKDEIEQLEVAQNKEKSSDLTKVLKQIDSNRDDDLVGIKTVCEGFAYSRNKEISGPANLVLKSISKHGSMIHTLNYHAETSVVDAITGEWKEEKFQKALKKLQLHEWSVSLERENNDFKEHRQERVDDKMELESESFTKLRKPAVDAYNSLCDEIFAHSILNKNQEYTDLVKAINIIIEEYKMTLERRKGKDIETDDEL